MAMVNTFFEKIGGFFDKDFLFASLVPTLVMLIWVLGTTVVIVGPSASFAWYDELSALQGTTLLVMTVIVVIVLAYVASALRLTLLNIWSGRSELWPLRPLLRSLQQREKRRYASLRRKVPDRLEWAAITQHFRERIRGVWSADRDAVPPDQLMELRAGTERLKGIQERGEVERHIDDLVEVFREYSGESLSDIYALTSRILSSKEEKEQMDANNAQVRLGTQFVHDVCRPTRLGNLVEAYDAYSFMRYRVDMSVLWPRLQHAIEPRFLERIQDRRMQLDFALCLATGFAVLGFASLIGGPWVWTEPRFWLPLGLFQLLISFLFYLLAVQAAAAFGEFLRASCDLFRLDLLQQLYRPHPVHLEAERAIWRQISQLALYGEVESRFPLRPRVDRPQ